MADTIVRVFDHPGDALQAVRRVEALGVDHDDVSLIANNREGWYDDKGVRHDRLRKKDDDLDGKDDRVEGAGGGAVTGGLLGGGAGLLAGLGMLAIPGLGPVVAAGWLASTAAGATAGAVAGGVLGGVLGALTHEGVDRKDAEIYAESVRRGGAVVVVRKPGARRQEIEKALSDYSTDAAGRGEYYRSGGWTGYDPAGPEFDTQQIEDERARTASFRPGTRM